MTATIKADDPRVARFRTTFDTHPSRSWEVSAAAALTEFLADREREAQGGPPAAISQGPPGPTVRAMADFLRDQASQAMAEAETAAETARAYHLSEAAHLLLHRQEITG